jgi:transposase
VTERLGVCTKSIYDWFKLYGQPEAHRDEVDAQLAENRRFKSELARVTEERDILKNYLGFWPACAR